MKKYSTKKSNNIFKKINVSGLKKDIDELNEHINFLKNKSQQMPYSFEYHDMRKQISNYRRMKSELEKDFYNIRNKIIKFGSVLGITLSVATAYSLDNSAIEDYNNTINDSYTFIQQNNDSNLNIENDDTDLLYSQFKNDIKKYVELSNQNEFDDNYKKELKNLKERINHNPECVTKLSLDILKQKIANSLNIEDSSTIYIINTDTSVPDGSIKNISIYANDQTVASLKQLTNRSDGTTITEADTLPKDIKNVIEKIRKAQDDPQNANIAVKALKASVKLDEKNISFETNKSEQKSNDLNDAR